MKDYPITVPSPQEQKQIVSTLERPDSLVNKNSISLSVEFEARRNKCEHYRDKLFTFEEWVA